MIVRKSYLRRRAELGPEIRSTSHSGRSPSLLGAITRLVLQGTVTGTWARPGAELEGLPLPDLLAPDPGAGPDPERLINQLDLAFLGRASTGELRAELNGMPAGDSDWQPQHFIEDLFIRHLVVATHVVRIRGHKLPMHTDFLVNVLSHPPRDRTTIRFRQAILREIESQATIRAASEELVLRLFELITLLEASRDDARLEPFRFRLDVLRGFRNVVDLMADGFRDARSGLQRIAATGDKIRRSAAFATMAALLDHHANMAMLTLNAIVGGDGRLQHLEITELKENTKNRFFRRPLRRWFDRLRLAYHRYNFDSEEVVDRLVMGVYQEVGPAIARVVQLVCHLELYVGARAFAEDAQARGLRVCLPEISDPPLLELEELFNPLLLVMMQRPVPSDLRVDPSAPTTVVTGPNSGGKTRLLQAVGIAQILGQSGLYVPGASARIPPVAGLFASIVEFDRADQSEGRLGTELVRLRTLFETVPPGSLVLLDELCSGTNPSEAIEIVEMVLRLLARLRPVAFVTTHFLDFAQQLREAATIPGLSFLHAEVEPVRGATFRFIPGVATTSLAVGTAERLGVTFAELENTLRSRLDGLGDDPAA